MILSKEIKDVVEKMKRASDKTSEVYSVRSCGRNTEITVLGEDNKGRKFCRVITCSANVTKLVWRNLTKRPKARSIITPCFFYCYLTSSVILPSFIFIVTVESILSQSWYFIIDWPKAELFLDTFSLYFNVLH